MKKLFYSVALVALLASCGSNKSEKDAATDSPAVDSAADAPMPVNHDTISVTTDTVTRTSPGVDSVVPNP